MRRDRFFRLAALASVAALVTSGCLQSDEGSSGSAADTAEGDGSITIIGAIPDEEATGMVDALATFTEQSGIEVTYTASSDFTTEINSRVQGGNPPEVALFPQPGLVLEFADSGDAIPLGDLVDLGPIEESLIPGFLDSVTDASGESYAVPMRMAVKSLVWYPKKAWEEAGYQVPETWDDLIALSDQIVADGQAPWCIGAESGPDTGWVFTDWMEELMLRTAGPETYDKWVSHDIPFDDPAVVDAGNMFGDIMFTDGYVFGGPDGALSTPFADADNPMWEASPSCWMMRQANFATTIFPEDVMANLEEEVGVFVLPPVPDGYDGTPILGGGDMAAAFVNDSDVVELMEFVGSDQFGAEWAASGGWLSAHTTFDASKYPDDTTREIFEIAAGADVFRFDGSDLMPASVGAGTFWDEMNNWIGGKTELAEALTSVDESWPSS